jgi:hypothetical protein
MKETKIFSLQRFVNNVCFMDADFASEAIVSLFRS